MKRAKIVATLGPASAKQDILESMLNITPLPVDALIDESKVLAFGESLINELNASLPATSQYSIESIEDEGVYGIKLLRRVHGNDYEVNLEGSFFKAPDYLYDVHVLGTPVCQ